VIKSHLLCQLS